MPPNAIDLRTVQRGTVTAPAGCGKTQVIADTITAHRGSKPILVLTHTNAGVAALRGRLQRLRANPAAYRLATLDGWAMRLASYFPSRTGLNRDVLACRDARRDYPAIRTAARNLLQAGHLDDVLACSYDRMLVDEYQDCSTTQHGIIVGAARVLPGCVFGDPLQAIFGFGGNPVVNWNEVHRDFPPVATLDRPWRWINAGNEPLGSWLLTIREPLLTRQPIDLATAPSCVRHIVVVNAADTQPRLHAAQTRPPTRDGRVLVIGDSRNRQAQRLVARHTPGAVTVEAVDLQDLIGFANAFDPTAAESVDQIITFAEEVMTNVGGPELRRRIATLLSGSARKPPSLIEQAALDYHRSRTHAHAAALFRAISQGDHVRVHRDTVLRCCIRALEACRADLSFADAAIQARERNRVLGRFLPSRAVGSNLLLKGLEAETVVILSADEMDHANLYVALTRASHMVVVCSQGRILPPPG
jgi:hypothetical protein